MWPRVCEIALACWIALSPFIFRYGQGEPRTLWVTAFVCATLVAVFALASYIRRLDKAHLLSLGVAAWLVGTAMLHEQSPPPPPYQNHVVTGLLLLIFAILPSHAERPPAAWEDYYRKHPEAGEPAGNAAGQT